MDKLNEQIKELFIEKNHLETQCKDSQDLLQIQRNLFENQEKRNETNNS